MDWSVRALRLATAIKEAEPGIECDVRITQKKIERDHEPYDLFVVVVTVVISGIGHYITHKERHAAHEQIALEFWQDIAQNSLLSIQLVG